jgi:hypothetical protein
MWFIITFFTIAGILQLVNIVGFFISLIETIFRIEIFKENSWMDRILAKYILKPLAIIFLVMFGLLIIWRIMCFVLGHNC